MYRGAYSAHGRRKIGRRHGGWRGGRRQNRSRCRRQKRGRQGSVERPGTGSLGHPAVGEDVSASAAGFEAELCARNPRRRRRLSIPSDVTLSDDDGTRAARTLTQYYARRKDSKTDLLRILRGQDNIIVIIHLSSVSIILQYHFKRRQYRHLPII